MIITFDDIQKNEQCSFEQKRIEYAKLIRKLNDLSFEQRVNVMIQFGVVMSLIELYKQLDNSEK